MNVSYGLYLSVKHLEQIQDNYLKSCIKDQNVRIVKYKCFNLTETLIGIHYLTRCGVNHDKYHNR